MKRTFLILILCVLAVSMLVYCTKEDKKLVQEKEVKIAEVVDDPTKKPLALVRLKKTHKENVKDYIVRKKILPISLEELLFNLFLNSVDGSAGGMMMEACDASSTTEPVLKKYGGTIADFEMLTELSKPDLSLIKRGERGGLGAEFYLEQSDKFLEANKGLFDELFGFANIVNNVQLASIWGVSDVRDNSYRGEVTYYLLINGYWNQRALLDISFDTEGSVNGFGLSFHSYEPEKKCSTINAFEVNIITVEDAKKKESGEYLAKALKEGWVSSETIKNGGNLMELEYYYYQHRYSFVGRTESPVIISNAPYLIWPVGVTFKKGLKLATDYSSLVNVGSGEVLWALADDPHWEGTALPPWHYMENLWNPWKE